MIRLLRSNSLLVPLSFLLWCCNVSQQEEKKAIHEVIFKLIEADNKSDISAILNAYTDSIEFYPPGGGFIRGPEAVRNSYEELFREHKLDLKTEITETEICKNHATIAGINTGTKMSLIDSSLTPIKDRYLAIVVYNDKVGWKINKLAWCKN